MKTIISTGQGRLHLIESAKAIKKAGNPYKYKQAVSDIIATQKEHTTG